MQRSPAVAGQFYPGHAASLARDLDRYLGTPAAEPFPAKGIIAPHAGYIYSGAIAGKVYGAVRIPATILILGPNHHGAGAAAALYPEGEWLTPLGPVPINTRLNALIEAHAPFVRQDTAAHRFEHSLEVQVPFLQHLRPDVTISALCLGFGDYPTVHALGTAIAAAIAEFGQEVLIVASSDMTHYESADAAAAKDRLALERVLALNPQGLLNVCRSDRITMCGVVPSSVMLVAALTLGAQKAEVIAYGTSGDITGDNRQVVGYAAAMIC